MAEPRPKGKQAKKSTAAEVERRTNEFVEFLAEGRPRRFLVKYAKIEWGLCENSADKYIARARDALKKDFALERADFLAEKMSILQASLDDARRKGQNSNVTGIVRLMCELVGAFPPK